MIEGPWGAPRIYPDMQGILDNPDAAYAKLKEMGKGLFGPNGARARARRSAGCSAAASRVDQARRRRPRRAAASRAICSAASSARPSAICCSRD